MSLTYSIGLSVAISISPAFSSKNRFFSALSVSSEDFIRTTLNLCAGGRLCLENLLGETHSPVECPEVYNRLIFDKDFPVVVQFDWRALQ